MTEFANIWANYKTSNIISIHFKTKHFLNVLGLMIANTDSRHYLSLAKQIYRLLPYVLTADEVASIHGKNEYLSTKNFRSTIEFFLRFITRASNVKQVLS